jgi:hypothetical protein
MSCLFPLNKTGSCAHSAIRIKQILIHTDISYHGTQFFSLAMARLASTNNFNFLSHSTNMQHTTHSKAVLFTTGNTVTCFKSQIVPLA